MLAQTPSRRRPPRTVLWLTSGPEHSEALYFFFSWLTLLSGRAGPSAGQILWRASFWLAVRSAAAELKRPGSTGGRDRAVRHARSFLCLPRTPLSAWAAGASVHVPVDGGRARQKVSWGKDGRRREASRSPSSPSSRPFFFSQLSSSSLPLDSSLALLDTLLVAGHPRHLASPSFITPAPPSNLVRPPWPSVSRRLP